MQKCSLCGGKVVDGRCVECGLPIPPEHRYTLRGETSHIHEVNGEPVLHRVRVDPRKRDVPQDEDEPPRRTVPARRQSTRRGNAPAPRGTAQNKAGNMGCTLALLIFMILFFGNVLPALLR